MCYIAEEERSEIQDVVHDDEQQEPPCLHIDFPERNLRDSTDAVATREA